MSFFFSRRELLVVLFFLVALVSLSRRIVFHFIFCVRFAPLLYEDSAGLYLTNSDDEEERG